MTTLILNSQFKQFDLNGEPLAAGKVYTYEVGTTTPKTTYQDEDKVAAHTNPIILDSFGEATIWIDGNTKLVVKDSDDVTIRTYPSFEDEAPTGEFPVVSSPLGAVYRSTATDVGYIKIQLPMNEWPNTKMMFDVMIYTDDADEAFTLTLGGYADSNTSSWLTTTAITNGITDYTVQFGNDGTYPAVYIGGVASSWAKPQIAVTNFLAGEFSYDWDTWDNGWAISVTTSLGTITSTPTLVKKLTLASTAETITGTNDTKATHPAGVKGAIDAAVGWDSWQTGTFYSTGITWDSGGFVRYRKRLDGSQLEIAVGGLKNSGTGNEIFELPSDYRPLIQCALAAQRDDIAEEASIARIPTGATPVSLPTTIPDGTTVRVNGIIPLDLDVT